MAHNDGLPQVRFAHRFLSSRPVAFHVHPCPELVLVTRGSCVVRVGKTPFKGRRGDVFVLPAHVEHDQVGTGMVGTLYIGFLPGAEGVEDAPRVISTGNDRYTREWIRTIVDLTADAGTTATPIIVGGLMTALLARLRALHRGIAEAPHPHPKVNAALGHVRRTMRDSLDVRTISRAVGVSPSHLRTLFRHHVGVSPTQYQKSLRMNFARQRLVDPYPSIKEVAVECGYRDVNLFIRLFRKQHGRSPGRWRQDVANRA
jgi:AraC-like DNA-binding protein